MSDIFISYASEDKSRVQALARVLEQKGWSVWWDRRIPAGKSFDEVIHEALKSARSVVVVWTKTSVKSTWVKNESRSGLRRNILFPVMLLEEVEIPLEFEHLQAAHLMDWQPRQEHAGFEQFVDDLIGVIGAPAPQSQALPASSAKQTSEPKAEPLSRSAVEVEHEPERLEPKPHGMLDDPEPPDSPKESFAPERAMGFPGAVQKSAPVNKDHSIESISSTSSTQSVPYLPAGLGLLAVIGAVVVYWVTASTSPSLKSEPPSARSVVQTLSAQNQVPTEHPVTVPTEMPPLTPSPEKPAVVTEAKVPSRLDTKLGPSASPSKKSTGMDVASKGTKSERTAEAKLARRSPSPSDNRTQGSHSSPPVQQQPVPTGETQSRERTQLMKPKEASASSSSTPVLQSSESIQQQSTKQSVLSAEARPIEKRPTQITGKDGAPMVLIPAGSFLMGSTTDEVDQAIKNCIREKEEDQQTCEGWYKPELPQHKVKIDAFYFDKYEVTNRLFQQFVTETGYQTAREKEGSALSAMDGKEGWREVKGANWQRPEGGTSVFQSDRADHPVVAVSWDDAVAFCQWADKRLPTEAEWEYAARAGTTTKYWWGQGHPGNRRVENIADVTAKTQLQLIMPGYVDGAVRTAPVGYYETNPWGLYDISGNVREWTADWLDGDYYRKSPEHNPKGPSTGKDRVPRGGSWADGPDAIRSAVRDWAPPTDRSGLVGFRCAQDPLPPPKSLDWTQQLAIKQNAPLPQVQPTGNLRSAITGKDGAPMVLIPAGNFQMGSTEDEVGRALQDCIKELGKDQPPCKSLGKPELPQHRVQMDAFILDKYEVTNRLFQQFVKQSGYRSTAEREGSAWAFVEGKGGEDVMGASWLKPEAGATVFDSNRTEHPVVSVSWDDAQAYCQWAGKRLPTEAEFEYAMRGGTTTTYWWGNGNPGSRRVENTADETSKNLLKYIMKGYVDGSVQAAPVGSYEANPWGLHDMSGNVGEWTADWYGGDYYGNSPPRNPKGPLSGLKRVIRGGSWINGPDSIRSANRGWDTPTTRGCIVGFRCAQDVPK